MNKTIADVKHFSEVFGKLVNKKPTMVDNKDFEFVYEFIKEELDEMKEAHEKGDLVGVLDALADIQYVLNAGVLAYGMQDVFDTAFQEVQDSNMSKSCETEEIAKKTVEERSKTHGPCHYEKVGDQYIVYRTRDKKVMKSINYFRPDLKTILNNFLNK